MPYDPVPQSDQASRSPVSSSIQISSHFHSPIQSPPTQLAPLDPLPTPPHFNQPPARFIHNHNQLHQHQLQHQHQPQLQHQPQHQHQPAHRLSTSASNHSSFEPSTSDSFSSAEDELPIPNHSNIPSSSSHSPTNHQLQLNLPSSSSHPHSLPSHHSFHSPSSTSSSSPTLLQPLTPQHPPPHPKSSSARLRDSYANTYGAPVSAAGPDLSSLNAIASGLVGGDYGPFPQELMTGGVGTYSSSFNPHRLSPTLDRSSPTPSYNRLRGSATSASDRPSAIFAQKHPPVETAEFGYLSFGPGGERRGVISHSNHHFKGRRPPSADGYSGSLRDSLVSYDENGSHGHGAHALAPPLGIGYVGAFSETTEDLLWKDANKEPDDFLHDPDPELDLRADKRIILNTRRGWINALSLGVLVSGLVGLFALYPILSYVLKRGPTAMGWNLGGINGTGQVPDIPNLPKLIDATTPQDAKTRTGFDGKKYNLVFSDEFNTDGRTFWPGDDPYWEAVDLHYWQTTNFEWYDPDAVTTRDGNLVIQIDRESIHDLRARSGMIQSWNKFCFTEGYIEVNISLPGAPGVQGLWPGVWTMGNLARAGFGASNEGMWPYSYEACDVGTLPNQTMPDGVTPPAAKTSGSRDYGGELSWLPGQRTSACTCKGEDHPGPSVDVGRSGPEIDVLEAQYAYGPNGNLGSMSQSIQIAPMDEAYGWQNDSSSMHIVNQATSTKQSSGTIINQWHGSIWQESLSGITITDGTSYEGKGYQTFGFEYQKGFQADGGRVQWAWNGQETWSIYASAIGGASGTQISPRPISTEPMYVILNLGISNKFQTVEWEKLNFPARMYIDYVRIYQREGHTNIGCSPKDRPTEDYIKRHIGAYTNANFTTWAEAGFTKPKNRLKDQC